MKRFQGRVAFITGAARGQGRSHALRLAEEGADIVAVDICGDIDLVPYELGTADELAETADGVERLGRKVVARQGDVRDSARMKEIVAEAVGELARIDVVIANAGIAATSLQEEDPDGIFETTVAINQTGVRNAVQAAVPQLIAQGEGGAIIVTSSTQGLKGAGGNGQGATDGYVSSKHAVVGLMRSWAYWLAPHNIRVNSVHPTGVETPMITNDSFTEFLEKSPPETLSGLQNLMDVSMLQASDISNAVAWLASDEARYVTGVTLPVDAGFMAR